MVAGNRAAAKARVIAGRPSLGAEGRSRMQTRSSHAGGAALESEYLGPFDKWKPMTTVQRTFPDVRIVLLIIVAACLATVKGEAAGDDRSPFAAIYPDQRVFLDAIARERPRAVADLPVTGISVPHHLLAADLMARGFWAAAGNRYERIVILSPDHFNRSRRPLATTRRNFDTAFELLENDRAASGTLLEASELFDDSDLFEKEHGIAALLPFVKYFFAGARIVPIVISNSATRADWDKALPLIEKLVGPRVLVIQSTDYSHYLPLNVAVQRDQETLNIIAAGDVGGIERLGQPIHMDSKAAQYLQMRLQNAVLGSHPVVVGNRNSHAYSASAFGTTSYIVTVYTQTAAVGSQLRYGDHEVVYMAGDAYLGRWLTAPLANPDVARAVVAQVKALTGGAPLVVNLEGVLLEDPPAGLPNDILFMHASLAVPILEAMNVRAASMANNHSYDLGAAGYDETRSILARAGIRPLPHKEIVDIGPVRLVALNFVGPRDQPGYPVVKDSELEELCRVSARPPLIAFVHWGQEYATAAGPSEYAAAAALQACGVSAIVGAHSHRAAPRIEALQGGEYQVTFSLGNFLFDQKADRSSSALLELRIFEQGTFAARLVPAPNLFELAAAELQRNKERSIRTRETTSAGSKAD
jgi:AmmeMemoRadiSam system protein B